ncbi:type II secretion system (T2SS) protein F [Tamaricihabitans halophyticus]|uniref:Type II secretion system (T2SS) protein F n=1 Tax=Tamaricihabitans halophyticus TaxID=1262583 RepID=A0A4R2R292_9PSEU|nr:type II secretion system F family protein [Tamaricihabitans halophyticus]TCP56850.1 type II secretion system (T2SS) protein F [Tamaricihabitans halophyticus]
MTVSIVLIAIALLSYPAARTATSRMTRIHGARNRTGTRVATTGWLPLTCGLGLGASVLALLGPPSGWLWAPLVTALTWWGARRWVTRAGASARHPQADQLRIAASWELLAACLRAGLPVPTAIRAIAGTLPPGAAIALDACAEQLSLGADPERAWRPAREQPATAAFARNARRTARSGTALAEVAATQAERLRGEATTAAEATAQRAGVLITGPLGLCFLPAFLCLGIVPVIIGLASGLAPVVAR